MNDKNYFKPDSNKRVRVGRKKSRQKGKTDVFSMYLLVVKIYPAFISSDPFSGNYFSLTFEKCFVNDLGIFDAHKSNHQLFESPTLRKNDLF